MIEYHAENGRAPWICKVGRRRKIWFAYTSLWRAIMKFPGLAWRCRNIGS